MKDARTWIRTADGSFFLNLTGNDGMATAGSGDVLCGVVAGLLGQGMNPSKAAPFAVWLHGLAGESRPPLPKGARFHEKLQIFFPVLKHSCAENGQSRIEYTGENKL